MVGADNIRIVEKKSNAFFRKVCKMDNPLNIFITVGLLIWLSTLAFGFWIGLKTGFKKVKKAKMKQREKLWGISSN